jgi:2-polyprenyl-6-methoxyphenol hydroxylase-like FAD-dependent oxidoreductase
VAGGGIAGLTVATALARKGWAVRVHERDSELRELGAGIAVWQNGLIALDMIGALEAALSDAERVEEWQLRDHRGKLLQHTWMLPGSVDNYTVLRTSLLRALADTAVDAGVEIVTNSRLVSARPQGGIELASGERVDADLVVGADGINSAVRTSLGVKSVIRDLGDGCGRHLIDRREGDVAGKIVETWDGGRRIGLVPCHPDKVYIYLCCPAGDLEGRDQEDGRLETWKQSFPQYAGYIDRIPAGQPWLPFGDVQAPRWSRGRVAIVGDAASAMPPNLGQAGCLAMVNGVLLAEHLDGHADVEEALQAWERSERGVTDQTQRYSRFYGRIGTDWPRSMQDTRSAIIGLLARSEKFQARVNVATRYRPISYRDGAVGAARPVDLAHAA